MSDTKQKCEACGNENEGKYHKYHYGRWLKEGEDFILKTLEKSIYRWTTHYGGGSSTRYFYKHGEKEVFICNNCYEREKAAHGKKADSELGSKMAIALSDGKNKYEECITDEWFRTFRSQDSSSCFIATACYGSADCREVIILRNFRDKQLLKSRFGRIAVKCYYFFSPTVASWIKTRPTCQKIIITYFIAPLLNLINNKINIKSRGSPIRRLLSSEKDFP